MVAAVFDFRPDLDFFLSANRRKGPFTYCFDAGQSVKHLIESFGLPHTEIGYIQVDQVRVELNYPVQDGDRVAVFPPAPGQALPPSGPHFVLDNHLGRLAVYLRILGFDVLYRNDLQDEELASISEQEQRILLTRDRRLLMRSKVIFGYCLRNLDSRRQVQEVFGRYQLSAFALPFKRCIHCNTLLEPVDKQSILDQLEPLTRLYYDEFQRCPACGQIYWKGSHYEHMLKWVKDLTGA